MKMKEEVKAKRKGDDNDDEGDDDDDIGDEDFSSSKINLNYKGMNQFEGASKTLTQY
jgi:hypothetical protein